MSSTILESRSRYTPEQITTGLTVLALCGGDAARAEAQLAEQAQRIPESTLKSWRETFHPDRYREISHELAPRIEEQVVHLQREIATTASRAALKALALEAERLDAGQVKDASASARNLSTVAGIATDKILALTGRPTSVIEHRTVDESLQRLHRLGLVVDGTATEETQASEAETSAAA